MPNKKDRETEEEFEKFDKANGYNHVCIRGRIRQKIQRSEGRQDWKAIPQDSSKPER
jgi:hypothetical protein